MRTGSFVVVVVFGALLAGCSDKAAPAPSATEEDPYVLGEGVSNVLQGLVLSDEGLPIMNATVKLPANGNQTATNEYGEYRFENLEPRDYIVVVEKEGYRPKTLRAIIEDGKIFQLDFKLEERPLAAPYDELLPWDLFLSCQVAYASNPETVEKRDCASVQGTNLDPNNDPFHDFEFGAGGAQLIIEADWTPTQDISRNLSIEVASVGIMTGDIEFGATTGPPPLKVPIGQSLMGRYFGEGGKVRVEMGAAPGALGRPDDYDAGWAFQQEVKLYVTVFYIDPGPPGFSAISG